MTHVSREKIVRVEHGTMRIAPHHGEKIEALRRPTPRIGTTALSPVCEPIGHANEPKHHINHEQIVSETALEAGSNY
jgi:hypothetical protein